MDTLLRHSVPGRKASCNGVIEELATGRRGECLLPKETDAGAFPADTYALRFRRLAKAAGFESFQARDIYRSVKTGMVDLRVSLEARATDS